jgi:Matrixin
MILRFQPLILSLLLAACEGDPGRPPDEDLGQSHRTIVLGPSSPEVVTRQDLVAGDQVVDVGISAVVPAIGETVTGVADLVAGGARALQIEHRADGAVIISRGERVAQGIPAPSRQLTTCLAPQCTDGAYNLMGWKWAWRLDWKFAAWTTPSANDVDNVEARFTEAVRNITTAHNRCGLSDYVSATQEYWGRTSLGPNITGSTTDLHCAARDGWSVVGFRVLPSDTLAYTCAWNKNGTTYGTGTAIEADIALNKTQTWLALSIVPDSCQYAYMIEDVATHEFGHVFGLAHVCNPNLTMSPYIDPCDYSDDSLGLGDVRGLQALY